MKKLLTGVVCIALALSITGCQNMNKQDVGTLTGGALGALVGSRFGGGSGQAVAIAAGAIVGALVGGHIGKSMDQVDQTKVNSTLETSHTKQTTSWRNPDSGNVYYVTPTKTYKNKAKQYCREYTTKAIINGKEQTVYGKACRKPDGSWKIVK